MGLSIGEHVVLGKRCTLLYAQLDAIRIAVGNTYGRSISQYAIRARDMVGDLCVLLEDKYEAAVRAVPGESYDRSLYVPTDLVLRVPREIRRRRPGKLSLEEHRDLAEAVTHATASIESQSDPSHLANLVGLAFGAKFCDQVLWVDRYMMFLRTAIDDKFRIEHPVTYDQNWYRAWGGCYVARPRSRLPRVYRS